MPNFFSGGPNDNGMDISTLGRHLRALREAQGLSYDDVAAATHVRPHVLQAIEEGRIDAVAAPIYAKGFIKTYCEYLLATDLWKKYSQNLPAPERSGASQKEGRGASVDINHPTPMFRRSSIFWVYVVLILAVAGAAFLLWSQHNDPGTGDNGFFLRMTEPVAPESDPAPPALSPDLIDREPETRSPDITLPSAVSAEVLSASVRSEPSADVPQMPSSPAPAARSADLSWMDGGTAPVSAGPPVPLRVSQATDRKLLVEITGQNVRLVVQQDNKIITRRMLSAGGKRTYNVSRDTIMTLSEGRGADITWYGHKYMNIGSDSEELSMLFRPDGSVRVLSGSSAYFASPPETGGAL